MVRSYYWQGVNKNDHHDDEDDEDDDYQADHLGKLYLQRVSTCLPVSAFVARFPAAGLLRAAPFPVSGRVVSGRYTRAGH